jgi:hypothetical protein
MAPPAWTCAPGSTLLVPSGPSGNHLFVIALGPALLPCRGTRPHVVMVSATTLTKGLHYDPACVLNPGDHPFIHRTSYISYRHARVDPAADVESKILSGYCTPHVPCQKQLLDRIVAGARLSRLISREFKQLFL